MPQPQPHVTTRPNPSSSSSFSSSFVSLSSSQAPAPGQAQTQTQGLAEGRRAQTPNRFYHGPTPSQSFSNINNTSTNNSSSYNYNRSRSASTRSDNPEPIPYPSNRTLNHQNGNNGSSNSSSSNNFHYYQKPRQDSRTRGYSGGGGAEDGIGLNLSAGRTRAGSQSRATQPANDSTSTVEGHFYNNYNNSSNSTNNNHDGDRNRNGNRDRDRDNKTNNNNNYNNYNFNYNSQQQQQQQQQRQIPPRAASSTGHRSSTSIFASGAPPRTSSLLPPPRETNYRTILPPTANLPSLNSNSNSNSNSNLTSINTTTTTLTTTTTTTKNNHNNQYNNNDTSKKQQPHPSFSSSLSKPDHPPDFSSGPPSAIATTVLHVHPPEYRQSQDPANPHAVVATFLEPISPAPPSVRRPSQSAAAADRSHSRASSIGAISDGFRNLNRWSSSTTSSRASAWDPNHNHNLHHHHHPHNLQQPQRPPPPPNNFSRRMSVDSIALLAQQSQSSDSPFKQSTPERASPRKLSKRRPSTGVSPKAGGVVVNRRPSSPPPPPSAPPPNLPPIIALSPLNTDPEPSLKPDSPRQMSRASPAVGTPNSVFSSQHNGEPQDYFWNELSNPSRTASPVATRANPALLPPATVTRDDMTERKGHTRSRSSAAKSSGDSTKRSGKPSQKAMLSKALSKANIAVQLDNAQNYGAARESYLEACELLQQVLARTNGEDDRKKLEAIRRTYTSRIEDLDGLVPVSTQNHKALPSRPDSVDYHDVQMELAGGETPVETATATTVTRIQPPVMEPRAAEETPFGTSPDRYLPQSTFTRSPRRRNFEGSSLSIPRANEGFIPAPLSPRRPISPAKPPSPEPIVRRDFSLPSDRLMPAPDLGRGHRRNLSHESASWLDPIDESGGSTASSVHSRSSSRIRRRHIRNVSGDTEAEFDAALDAAVEAAYDDGYEPMSPRGTSYDVDEMDVVAKALRKVELAKERVRQTEREAAIELAKERERQRQMSLSQGSQSFSGNFFDNDSDDEERVLDEMTRRYRMENFGLDQQSRYGVPRESDSSGVTTRTWHSSMGSNPPTGTTALSTVTELPPSGPFSKTASPMLPPPPPQALPQVPPPRPSSASGVRSRRLSGQNPKQLKIETAQINRPPNMPLPPVGSAAQSRAAGGFAAQQRQVQSATSTRPGPFSMRAPTSPIRGVSPGEAFAPASPSRNYTLGQDVDEPRTGSPSSVRGGMRKNFSSSSLKSLKSRQFSSVSQIDDSDLSPNTPLSHQISNTSTARQPALPALPTPLAAAFQDKMTGIGGLHLFDSDFHSPTAHSPNSAHHQNNPDAPMPLEPCPSDVTLRPFWLMRALYQTLAHPRGGYISNRLFVPRDAWKVKGVKLKALDDKISQCDLLTAALLKLARVDSNDADAVLEEMQSLESMLETVQMTLIRRLGNEVGTQGVSFLNSEKDGEGAPSVPRSSSVSQKPGAFSWRRLRTKGSAVNLTNSYGGKSTSGSGGGVSSAEKDTTNSVGSIASLPMVAHPSSRPAKRDVASVKFDGPWANYMASLARLFDAAQTVDQIARQVEDPGLRHADKTQVGLELCTRHAAEFFGFYICRFVLTDLSMLLDKFVKRGSEWVLN